MLEYLSEIEWLLFFDWSKNRSRPFIKALQMQVFLF